jgi:hypothetical protein
LFKSWLAYFEKRSDTFFGELMTCPMCLPYHVSFWLLILLWIPLESLAAPWDLLIRVPIYSLAITTLIHYMQGVLPVEVEDEPLEESNDDAVSSRPSD